MTERRIPTGDGSPARDLIHKLSRCADATTDNAVLNRDEARLLLTLWMTVNQAVATHAPDVKTDREVSRPLLALRQAAAAISSRRIPTGDGSPAHREVSP